MFNFTQTTLEFTPAQVKEALIWHYDLPKDTKISFCLISNHGYNAPEFHKAEASFKQDLKTKKQDTEIGFQEE